VAFEGNIQNGNCLQHHEHIFVMELNSNSPHSQSNARTIVDVCQVDEARAIQLLEATNGSVDRAIELHFHQIGNNNSTIPKNEVISSIDPSTVSKKREISSTCCNFTTPSTSKKISKHKTIDSFWGSSSTSINNEHTLFDDNESACVIDCLSSTHKENEKNESNKPNNHPFPENQESGTIAPINIHFSSDKQCKEHQACSPDHSYREQYPFAKVSRTLNTVADTSKRTIKFNTLKDLFLDIIQFLGGIHNHSSRVEEALVLAYTFDLILGKISTAKIDDGTELQNPPKILSLPQPIPLQVSGAAVSSAILTVTGISRQQLRQSYSKSGDLGDTAANFFGSMMSNSTKRFFVVQKEKVNNKRCISVKDVYSSLYNIATVDIGKGSQGTRQKLMIALLKSCQDKVEVRFVTRMLLGNMRLGATVKTVLGALAAAAFEMADTTELTNRNQPSMEVRNNTCKEKDFDPIKALQETFNVCPRVYDICNALLVGGIHHAVDTCCVSVGFPIHPMLAEPADSLDRVSKFLQNAEYQHLESVLEWKYDGVRCQAHWDSITNSTKLFSRHLLDNTSQFPDVVSYIMDAKNTSIQSFVIDSEIVAIQETPTFRLLPFQDLSARRGNKLTSSDSKDTVKVRVYCFDIVYLNGVSLLKLPFHERQTILRASFKSTHEFDFARSTLLPSYNVNVVSQALNEAIEGGAEGLMIKLTGRYYNMNEVPSRTFGYEAGSRSKLWLKLKRDYVAGYADTIDVVPIGAWFGTGRKAQKGFLSPILFAVYDDDDGTFKSISRCMSISDKMYNAMKDFYFHGIPYPPELGVDDKLLDDTGCEENNDSGEDKEGKHIDSVNNQNEADDASDIDAALEMSDEMSNLQQNRVNCYDSRPPSSIICTNETPTIWFKPLEVFEVSYADLSLSRIHTAAAGLIDDSESRGVAMRFPRFKRRRPDKTIEQATTCLEIASLYANQSKVK
jgi:DNA ligase 1